MTSDAGWKRRAELLLGVAASAILFAMMVLTFVDVVLRYVFNRPIASAFELTELMLVVLIFAGLPLVSLADEHAVMDFVEQRKACLLEGVEIAADGTGRDAGQRGEIVDRPAPRRLQFLENRPLADDLRVARHQDTRARIRPEVYSAAMTMPMMMIRMAAAVSNS